MRRGAVIEIELELPPGGIGREQTGRRPHVVISSGEDDPQNPLVTIIPFTKKINKARKPHTLIVEPSLENGLTVQSVLLAFQITSYDKERVIGVIGYLEPNYMRQLEQILRNMMRL